MKEQQNGYSICFNEWALDKDIKNELGLLLIISSLCAEKGYCYASNEYFATLFEINEVSVSRKLKILEDKNYITIDYKMSGNVVKSREIRLTKMLTAVNKNVNGAVNKNVKENNISINNISYNNIIDYYQDKVSILNPMQYEMLNNLIDKVGEDKVKDAIDTAICNGVNNLNYIIKVANNTTTIKNKKQASIPKWMNEFENYEEEEMTEEELKELQEEMEIFN